MKKVYYIALALLLLLIITNPGVKAFKDYLGTHINGNTKRESNFFIFSIYKYVNGFGGEYIGIAGNFFYIKPGKHNVVDSTKVDSAKMDSTKMMDTSKRNNATFLAYPVDTTKTNRKIQESISKEIDSFKRKK